VNAVSNTIRVFLDTSALFAATSSIEGGAYKILTLGAAQVIKLLVSPEVLQEIEGALRRKAPKNLGILAALLDRSLVEVVPIAPAGIVEKSQDLIGYLADAHVLAAAWDSSVDYFVTLDRQHFLSNAALRSALPFPLGTPGDFLIWFRERVRAEEQNG
jgi:predicted nucleic acid-binding protein